jgi:glutamate-1-semialdehyde 2,1-aminomutase
MIERARLRLVVVKQGAVPRDTGDARPRWGCSALPIRAHGSEAAVTPDDAMARAQAYFADLKAARAGIEARYRAATPLSARLHAAARGVLPGGSTRQGVYRLPYPMYVERAAGSVLVDADGREVVDFSFNATAMAVGHAHPQVEAAIAAQAGRGTAYFSPSRAEIDLASLIADRLPAADQVVFCNSGGEAVMMALRLARAFTGRTGIAKFEGSFHGNHDDVLWSVSPPAALLTVPVPTPVPGSPGLAGRQAPLVLPFNDLDTTHALIEQQAAQLAAVIVEPLAGRMGLVEAEPAFLEGLLRICARHGILVVFDEILSLRTGPGGMQRRLHLRPDLTTLGKIIGGGLPVGAVAGRADVMAWLDPGREGHVYPSRRTR